MYNLAILTTSENRSPRVLAETLAPLINSTGHSATVFYRVEALQRLNNAKISQIRPFRWLLIKALYAIKDLLFFRRLNKYDAVIVCGCTPFAFYRHTYNISELKKRIFNRPVLYYAVQFLGNAPTLVKKLKDGGHSLFERYDWHLSVSGVTEIRSKPVPPWSQVGLNLRSTGLKPNQKKKFLAVIDYAYPGNEEYLNLQISVLKEMCIDYFELKEDYTLHEIREIYKSASLFFIQSFEAFGLPIAECLACGSYIVTPDSAWPMSWRLDDQPDIHAKGDLPACFIVYNDRTDLKQKLTKILDNYDMEQTPRDVFNMFYSSYPFFYDGDKDALMSAIKKAIEVS